MRKKKERKCKGFRKGTREEEGVKQERKRVNERREREKGGEKKKEQKGQFLSKNRKCVKRMFLADIL